MNYFLVALRILRKLSREFDVPIPDLIQESPSKLFGWYCFDEIHISVDTLRSIHQTVKTSRHEFAHYLQDLFNIKNKTEVQARKFERNILALGKLPKSQTVLTEFFG